MSVHPETLPATSDLPPGLWSRLRRDKLKRPWWITQPHQGAKSRGEVLARQRFAKALLAGRVPSEAVWLACRADQGPPEDVSDGEWALWWSLERCSYVAACWLQDGEVQRELDRGGKAARGLASALSASAIGGLASIGHDSRVDPAVRARCLKAVAELGSGQQEGETPQDRDALRSAARSRAQQALEAKAGAAIAAAAIPGPAETSENRPRLLAAAQDEPRAIVPLSGGKAEGGESGAIDVTPPEDELDLAASGSLSSPPPWDRCAWCPPELPPHRRWTGPCQGRTPAGAKRAKGGGPDHEVSSGSASAASPSPVPHAISPPDPIGTGRPPPESGEVSLESLLEGQEKGSGVDEIHALLATLVQRPPQ